ncbi:hypothetical protein GOP47_0024364 [Adiantum capillus-veneris]|uniref:Uncharacterized protein n=1 Tax=Adiantum capillus-veneris TaxID=13818 RepID=A0A9D4U1R3_ADICA|nr:hypothetical protein GOP47_0024364 [Adiantum capillus-veneris]
MYADELCFNGEHKMRLLYIRGWDDDGAAAARLPSAHSPAHVGVVPFALYSMATLLLFVSMQLDRAAYDAPDFNLGFSNTRSTRR